MTVFPVAFGWGGKSKKVADAGIMKCGNCHNYAAFEIRKIFKEVNIYFIPVARWGKKYGLVCALCNGGYELDESGAKEIIAKSVSLPSNKTAMEIWAKLDAYLAKGLAKCKESDDPFGTAIAALVSEGYKSEDVMRIAGTFIRSIHETMVISAGLVSKDASAEEFDKAIAELQATEEP